LLRVRTLSCTAPAACAPWTSKGAACRPVVARLPSRG
jgi:hypothetical protein